MRVFRLVFFLFLVAWGGAASAEVEIAFYTKDMASTFPHAFVRLTGTDDSTGQPVDATYGFTPVSMSPGILLGRVRGTVEGVGPLYIARSVRHFSLKLSDEQYRTVLAVVEKWRSEPQPSYQLNNHNCTHFVAEIAAALGLSAAPDPKLMKKPKSFLSKVTRDNIALIEHWRDGTAIVAAPGSPAAASATPPR